MYENPANKEPVRMQPKFQELAQRVMSEMEVLPVQDQIEIVAQLKINLINQIEQKSGYHLEQIKVHEQYMNTAKSI